MIILLDRGGTMVEGLERFPYNVQEGNAETFQVLRTRYSLLLENHAREGRNINEIVEKTVGVVRI